MTRKVVAHEDSPYGDGRVIAGGALHVDDDRIPVCMMQEPDAIVGAAKDFERNSENGEISMDVVFFQYVNNDLDHYDAHVLVVPFETQNTGEEHVVTDGRIREVMLARKINGVEKAELALNDKETCENPQCPKGGHCGGECARDF